jgi:lipid-binding SYLF domain-containing protein
MRSTNASNQEDDMKKALLVILVMAVAVALPNPVCAQEDMSSDELKRAAKRAEIDEVAEETLKRLLKESERAKELYEQAFGWAVFDNTKVAFGVSGGGGRGVAVKKDSGERVYMKMGTAGVGLGLGVNKYQVIFFFQDESVARNFIEKGWQADAGATASAGKESAEGKTNFVNGLAIYQLTEKGLMLNADIAGTKYKQDDKLNE